MGKLRKIYNFLFRSFTEISLRKKPHIRVIYFNKRGKEVIPTPIRINGHVLDEEKDSRKVQKHGDSLYVSIPPGWVDLVAKKDSDGERLVRERLVLQGHNAHLIIISGYKGGNKSE